MSQNQIISELSTNPYFNKSSMTSRVFNFSAGPAVLPVEVLEEAKDNLLNFSGCGLGVMEMSHRGKEFKGIFESTKETLRNLAGIGEDYEVLFCTGGATQQYSMLPMNLISTTGKAGYLVSGSWSKKAIKEAKKFGTADDAGNSESNKYSSLPKIESIDENWAYLHFTSNNTIAGTQFAQEPESKGILLACDASSDIFSRPINLEKYGVIYAGTQKNLGIAGLTLVIIRKDLVEKSADNLPALMSYKSYADGDSLQNTIPTFPLYMTGLVLKWIEKNGGLKEVEQKNKRKASVLYEELDSNEFYTPFVSEKTDRSLMNVTFTLPTEELDAKFVKEATAAGLNGLKGHRSVGGLRASIYNAFPEEGVKALVDFMGDFAKKNG